MHSVLDRLDREDVRLHQPRHLTLMLTVYEGTWTTLSRSLLCITMILHVRRKFLLMKVGFCDVFVSSLNTNEVREVAAMANF